MLDTDLRLRQAGNSSEREQVHGAPDSPLRTAR
jgi:hypothetical protein